MSIFLNGLVPFLDIQILSGNVVSNGLDEFDSELDELGNIIGVNVSNYIDPSIDQIEEFNQDEVDFVDFEKRLNQIENYFLFFGIIFLLPFIFLNYRMLYKFFNLIGGSLVLLGIVLYLAYLSVAGFFLYFISFFPEFIFSSSESLEQVLLDIEGYFEFYSILLILIGAVVIVVNYFINYFRRRRRLNKV